VIACNRLPDFRDETDGTWRRLLVVPFERQINDARKDHELAERLVNTEIAGIAAWALEGLRRLYAQNRFTVSSRGEAALKRHRRRNNPVEEFWETEVDSDIDGFVTEADLWAAYARWCHDNNYRPGNSGTFKDAVYQCFGKQSTRPRRGSARPRGYDGVRLRSGVVQRVRTKRHADLERAFKPLHIERRLDQMDRQ
jgi:putative DNA primase/helicase